MNTLVQEEQHVQHEATRTAASVTSKSNDLPPLDSGDRLNRLEFERRYIQRPDIKKAELIEIFTLTYPTDYSKLLRAISRPESIT